VVVTDRGQAHTLDAIAAAVILVTTLVFALQVTAVTPLSASTSSQHIENQQRGLVEGVLTAAAEEGVLVPAVTYGNDTAAGSPDDGRFAFHQSGGDEGAYTNGAPHNRFGEMLNRTLGDRGLAFNVAVIYRTTSGGTGRQEMVDQGFPSDNAVAVGRTVTLYDTDELHEPESDGDDENFDIARPTGTDLSAAGDDIYMKDIASGSVFNVVRVEVVVWRQ
jgi:hypothetical protein